MNPAVAQTIRTISKLSAFCGLVAMLALTAPAQVPITQISNDTFKNTSSQHETEVEPSSFSAGSTIVSAFQVGRFTDGGASDIGFATSTDGGTTWTHGNLPGITNVEGTGKYDRASDTSVSYNLKYQTWIVETLALSNSGGVHGAAVLVNGSKDGITWSNAVTVSVVESGGYYDKPWIGCDNTSTSPHYGNCYIEWDDFALGDLIEMSTSTDGGKTWSAKQTTTGSASGTGGIPLVQPNGTVIVPGDDPFLSSVQAFKSTDGGKTWSAPVFVASINEHSVSGGMRALPLIGAQIDAGGKVYVVWADCSFRTNCASNDIVMSTSTNGTTWTAPARIPVDPVKSAIDHFTPGLGIEPGTSGSSAHLALTFDGLLQANCSTNCNLGVGYISSPNGGASWTPPKILSKGINPNWLASTSSGQMLGDYNGASYPGTKAHAVFATAKAPVSGTFNEPMDTNAAGLPLYSSDEPLFSSAKDKPVPNAHSQVRRTKPHRDDQR